MIAKKRLYEILDRIEEEAGDIYIGFDKEFGESTIYGIEKLEDYIKNIKYRLEVGLEP